MEARLVAVSRDSGTEPVPTAAKKEGTSSPDKGVSDSRVLTGVVRCNIGEATCTLLEAVLMLEQALHKGRFFACG